MNNNHSNLRLKFEDPSLCVQFDHLRFKEHLACLFLQLNSLSIHFLYV